jgi:FMN phosphatase YigB (HAD superfamily)
MSRQAITFDFHDTLVQCDAWFQLEIRTLPSAFLAWHQSARGGFAPESAGPGLERAYRRLRTSIVDHGHELTAERSLTVILDQAGFDIDDRVIAEGTRQIMTGALDSATIVAGAFETVDALSSAGFELGVVSSAVHHPFLDWSLARFGMSDRFRTVVTSAGSGYYKSRPEIYWSALHRLDADAHRSIHVGDSARFDVEGAARAGMRTAWLRRSGAVPPAVAPDLTLSSLEQSAPRLIELLRIVE